MPPKYKRIFFSVGLLSLFGGIALKLFFHIPDFINGFLVGFGLVLTISSQFVGREKSE